MTFVDRLDMKLLGIETGATPRDLMLKVGPATQSPVYHPLAPGHRVEWAILGSHFTGRVTKVSQDWLLVTQVSVRAARKHLSPDDGWLYRMGQAIT